ncbi:MAG: hypothetical protein K2M00_04395 [Muribaculaceae bacterium]|nr:hypothetical protein [Muribaculaceae bacterium]
MMTIKEAIERRCSTRTFTDDTPPRDEIATLCSAHSCLRPVDPALVGEGRVGSYGFISGRPDYVAVVTGDPFKAGIEGEKLVIELTRRGLGTCWLGATFNRKLVESVVKPGSDERVAAIIAVGHAAPRRRVLEKMGRMVMRSASRKKLEDLIIAGTPAPYLKEALEALRIAPSATNCQPWRLAFNPIGSIDVYGTPSDSFMKLDVGIGVSHFLMMRPDYRLSTNNNSHPRLVPITTLLPSDV